MKTLVHNFSSETTTEPMYLTQALLNLGHDAHLWANKMSAFDAFDTYDPELFITHAAFINNDIVKRLKGTNIKCVINISGLSEGVLPQVQSLADHVYVYQNLNNIRDVQVIQPCADIFLPPKLGVPEYEADCLFLVSESKQIDKIKGIAKGTYHVIGTSNDLNESKAVDAFLSLRELPSIYFNYKERFVGDISQVAYDAAYHGGSCGIISNSSTISMILKKETVKEIATPYNRLSDLFRMIGEVKLAEESKKFSENVK